MCIRDRITDDLVSIEPTVEAYETYDAELQAEISQMVWSHWSITNTHYKNANGTVHTLSPWPLHVYQAWTREPDFDKFELEPVSAAAERRSTAAGNESGRPDSA